MGTQGKAREAQRLGVLPSAPPRLGIGSNGEKEMERVVECARERPRSELEIGALERQT